MNKRLMLLLALALALVTLQSCQRQMVKSATPPPKPQVAQTSPPTASESEPKLSVTEKTPAKKEAKPAETKQPEKPGKGKDAAAKPAKPAEKGKQSADKQGKRTAQGERRPNAARLGSKVELMRMVILVSMIERSKDHTLKPDQAKKLLAILTPLRSKPKLTEDEAGKTATAMKKVFTADQLKVLDEMTARMSGQGRPGGQRPPQGQQNNVDVSKLPSQRVEFHNADRSPTGQQPPQGGPPAGMQGRRPEGFQRMEDYNPFYTKAAQDNPRARRNAQHVDEFFALLRQKAK